MIFQSIVQSILRIFNMEIRRIIKPSILKPGGRNAYSYNSRAVVESLYADQAIVERYLNADRLTFYSDVVALAKKNDIDFNGKSIVDAGCATGHFLKEILKSAAPGEIVGLDFSAKAVELARTICPEATFFQHDLNQKFGRTFDLVFCLEVLEHMEDPTGVLDNLTDMLEPGGTAVLTVPNGRIDQCLEHIHFWSPESWKLFIQSHSGRHGLGFSLWRLGRFNAAVLNRPGAARSGRPEKKPAPRREP